MLYGILYNQNAGDGSAQEVSVQVQTYLKQFDIESETLTGADVDEAQATLADALPRIDGLVVIGGDGTLNLAVTTMVQAKITVPLGIMPSGTVNNFARAMQIPGDLTAALPALVGEHLTPADICVGNGETAVVSSLTFGNLAAIGNDVRQREKQRLGKFAYLARALKEIGRNQSLPIQYTVDDAAPETYKTWFALITTTANVGGRKYSEAKPGRMHMSVLNNMRMRKVIPYLYFAWQGRLNHSKQVTYLTPKKVTLVSQGEAVQTRIDGDPGPSLPLTVEIMPGFLQVMV